MTWEEHLLALFDDLEQQAEGLALTERDARSSRSWPGPPTPPSTSGPACTRSPGRLLDLGVLGLGRLRAGWSRVGADFVLLETERETWVVRCAASRGSVGSPSRPSAATPGPCPARVGLGSVLRGSPRRPCRWRAPVDGEAVHGRVRRVGADFVELWTGRRRAARTEPVVAAGAVRRGRRRTGAADAPERGPALSRSVERQSVGRARERRATRLGLGVHPLDVGLELDGLDAVLPASPDLDRRAGPRCAPALAPARPRWRGSPRRRRASGSAARGRRSPCAPLCHRLLLLGDDPAAESVQKYGREMSIGRPQNVADDRLRTAP